MQSTQCIQKGMVLKQTLSDRDEITELWKELFYFQLSGLHLSLSSNTNLTEIAVWKGSLVQ